MPGMPVPLRFVLIVLAMLAPVAHAADRIVCASGGSYTSIGAAVAAASAGDTISICPGTYTEAVSVNKAGLIFRSSNGQRDAVTVQAVGNNVHTFRLTAPNIALRDMTIRSADGRAINSEWGGSGSHVFQNLAISSQSDAIIVENGGPHTFRNLKITAGAGGIAMAYNASSAHVFNGLDITSSGTAIAIGNGGPFNFADIKIASSAGGGISLADNADAAHTFTNIDISSRLDGISSARGASLIRNATIKSTAGAGLVIGNKYAGIYEDIKVEAAGKAFQILNRDSSAQPAHQMSRLDLTSTGQTGLEVGRSGKLTINDLKVSAALNAVQLDADALGPHEFRKANLVSSGGKGLSSHPGLSVLEDSVIKALGMSIDIGNKYDIQMTGISVSSDNATAINFNNNAAAGSRYTVRNVTVLKAGGAESDAMFFHTADNTPEVRIDNICVQSAGRHGINFHWNSRNVWVVNSIFKGHGGYGVYMGTNTNNVSHVNNSCFYQAPCAWSTTQNHDFSGNHWQPGVPACGNSNVNAASPLSTCPIPENVCYSGSTGGGTAPGGFNAFESSTAAGAIAGVIKTKIAGAAFGLDVVAINAAGNAIATGFSGEVKVEVLGNLQPGVALDANNCPLTSTVLSTQSLTFAAVEQGRKAVSIGAIANVWRDARLRMTWPATGTAQKVACSTDNFAIRPMHLGAVAASDTNWETAGTARTLGNTAASGGIVHKAGRPFSLSATAYNAGNAVTSSYGGTPTVKEVACTLPTPTCVNGTLSTGSWSGSGTVSTQNAAYSEAGAFNLVLEDRSFASVDQKAGDSSLAEYTIPQNAAVPVGRFVPDRFDLVAFGAEPRFATFDAACTAARSFTYIGQPFRYAHPPAARITARNAGGGITRNYSLNLWKLAASGVTQQYSANMPRGADIIGTPALFADAGNTGTGTINVAPGDTLAFTRNASTPQAPFQAVISLAMNVMDNAEAGAGQGSITTPAALVFNGGGSGIAFDAGAEFRYGRLRLENNHGSGGTNLLLRAHAQYWSGTGFVANGADQCTTIDKSAVRLADYAGDINATNMPQSHVLQGFTLQNGQGAIQLQKPSGAAGRGSVEVCIDLGPDNGGPACAASTSANKPWLQGPWGQVNHASDPRARATFGVNRGGPVIYMREMY